MDKENPELLKALVKALPYSFLVGLKESIPRLYMEAHAAVSADPLLGPAEVEYLIPHYRRALIEKALHDLTQDTMMHAVTMPNSKRTAKYTLIQSGNFIITESYLNDESARVRNAEFRSGYSKLNSLISQRSFDGEGFSLDESIKNIEGPIYCLLLHGPDPFDKKLPGFMKWAFPHPTANGWVAEFDFSAVLQAAFDLSPAKQNDGAIPTLKKNKDEGTGDE